MSNVTSPEECSQHVAFEGGRREAGILRVKLVGFFPFQGIEGIQGELCCPLGGWNCCCRTNL
jgi:hypothetical protein